LGGGINHWFIRMSDRRYEIPVLNLGENKIIGTKLPFFLKKDKA
jgi:hypothetical protein